MINVTSDVYGLNISFVDAAACLYCVQYNNIASCDDADADRQTDRQTGGRVDKRSPVAVVRCVCIPASTRRAVKKKELNPLTPTVAHCCHMGIHYSYPVPDRELSRPL